MATAETHDILQDDKLAKKIAVLNILLEEMKQADFKHLYKENDELSKLAVQKLLFFICLMEKQLRGDAARLFKIFDNFYALPLGHVESDILSHWDKIQPSKITSEEYRELKAYCSGLIKEINKSYPFLRNLDVTGLISLSHLMPSWRITFNIATKKEKKAELINTHLFDEDIKIIK